jgi:hypothetical protein
MNNRKHNKDPALKQFSCIGVLKTEREVTHDEGTFSSDKQLFH